MSRLPAFLSGLALLTAQLASVSADACTRLVYHGANDDVITARSMDWKVDVGTNLWIFPRGMARSGEAGPNSVKWTSRYGSVIATGYDISTTDGMNEAGLTANLLWLVESEYPHYDGKQLGMSIAIWTQYVLDNFATVKEAVDALGKESFVVVTDNIPVLTRLKSWKYAFESPFKADIYFLNTRLFTGNKWGTSNPIMMRDDDFGARRRRQPDDPPASPGHPRRRRLRRELRGQRRVGLGRARVWRDAAGRPLRHPDAAARRL